MLKTNSKIVCEKIKTIIIDCYNNSIEYYDFEGRETATNYNDICQDILHAFEVEKVNNNSYYEAGRISKQELFQDWMQGLPTAFHVADDIFYYRNAVDYLAELLEETDSEKARYTTEQAEKTACYLFYRELTKNAK